MDAPVTEIEDPDAVRVHSFGVRFFPYTPDMLEQIDAWAQEQDVQVLKTVPVYYEDPHERRRTE